MAAGIPAPRSVFSLPDFVVSIRAVGAATRRHRPLATQGEIMSEDDVMVVVSKLKNYIRAKSEMNTAGNVAPKISAMVRTLCDQAIERAKADGRKTVMDRDFEAR